MVLNILLKFKNVNMENNEILNITEALHDYSLRLGNIRKNLKPVQEFLGKNPFLELNYIEPNDVFNLIKSDTKGLLNLIINIESFLTQNTESRRIPHHLNIMISEHKIFLENYLSQERKPHPPFILEKILSIKETLIKLKREDVDNKKIRELLRQINEIERIIALYFFTMSFRQINDVENQLSSFKDYYSFDLSSKDPFKNILLLKILDKAKEQVLLDAAYKKIEFRLSENNNKETRVSGIEKELLRAFFNLYHNAVKYNDTLKNWPVYVETRINIKNEYIVVEIENWGQPITQEEIKNNDIFRPGYRGVMCGSNSSAGNGMELSLTKKIIEMHDGKIEVCSKPSQVGMKLNDYSNKFLTTVKVMLPII
jgi:signal transduction histidine kinase